eukprot:scaffold11763_cov71-Phaeocystis_antarctica.AAC.2
MSDGASSVVISLGSMCRSLSTKRLKAVPPKTQPRAPAMHTCTSSHIKVESPSQNSGSCSRLSTMETASTVR